RPAVLLVRRPDRDHRASGQRPFHAGPGRHGYRHQFRRHRILTRSDDRLAGRTGDADDRADGGVGRRFHPVIHHRGVLGLARGRAAGVAGIGADRSRVVFEIVALHLADRLPVLSVRHRPDRIGATTSSGRACALARETDHWRRVSGGVRDVDRQDARIPRAKLPRRGVHARPFGRAAAVRLSRYVMHGISFDIAHMLAGFLVLLSFLMLYQVRLLPLLHVLAAHAFVLALSVAWQAYIQHAPHLYIPAAIALVFKAIIVPVALRRMVFRMGIHREIETVVSIGLTMLAG